MKNILIKAYDIMIKPKIFDVDMKRREFILNTLLTGLICVTLFTILISGLHHLNESDHKNINSLIFTIVFLLILLTLKSFVFIGRVALAAKTFVGTIYSFALIMCLLWGFTLPIAQLLLALSVVSAGILISSRAAFTMAIAVSFSTLCIATLEMSKVISPNLYWTKLSFGLGDAYGFIAIFVIMGLISWLSNREIERSMQAERVLANSLANERNNLEKTLAKRSKELEQVQLVRVLELQRFAELGKISASFMHQVASPLTAASLDLQQLNHENYILVAERTRKNLDHLEKYLEAARSQLVGGGTTSTFSVDDEIMQVINLFEPKCNRVKVKLHFEQSKPVSIHGDNVKFNQLMANIINNAIDSFDSIHRQSNRKVVVGTNIAANKICISVKDYGSGIGKQNINKLFKAFYTTKTHDKRGMGIGLTIARQFVEQDFHGKIEVKSELNKGTLFTVSIPFQQSELNT